MPSLSWSQVYIEDEADVDGLYGYLKIVRGKSENAKGNFSITAIMREVLVRQRKISRSEFVFVCKDRKTPLSKWTRDKQQAMRRKAVNLILGRDHPFIPPQRCH